jgi:hypothetical protein
MHEFCMHQRVYQRKETRGLGSSPQHKVLPMGTMVDSTYQEDNPTYRSSISGLDLAKLSPSSQKAPTCLDMMGICSLSMGTWINYGDMNQTPVSGSPCSELKFYTCVV